MHVLLKPRSSLYTQPRVSSSDQRDACMLMDDINSQAVKKTHDASNESLITLKAFLQRVIFDGAGLTCAICSLKGLPFASPSWSTTISFPFCRIPDHMSVILALAFRSQKWKTEAKVLEFNITFCQPRATSSGLVEGDGRGWR